MSTPQPSTSLKKILLLLPLLTFAYLANRYGLLQKTLGWMEHLGPWAAPAYVLVYALTCVFFVPSFVFTLGAGTLFGLPWGIPLALLGTGLGSVSALAIGRTLARPWVEQQFKNNKQFHALSAAVKKKGWQMILLARLSPVFPFSIGNYGFGLTDLPARDYFFASMLGTIPSASVYVYLGSVAGSVAAANSGGRTRTPAEWALLLAGLAATILLVRMIQQIAKKSITEQLVGN